MAKYAVVLKQAGEGCDYTIGCGCRVEPLKATTSAEAIAEARAWICGDPEQGGTNWLLDNEAFGAPRLGLKSAKVVSIEAELPIEEWFAQYVERQAAEQRASREAAELAEYERLKAKLGR